MTNYMLNRFTYIKNLALAKKLTILMLIVFIGGISLSGIALANVLNYKAQHEITSEAWSLIQTLTNVRVYTSAEVTPELESRLQPEEFLPEVVPSFAARVIFEKLQKHDPAFKNLLYKEAMLNPTNVNDKANELETEIVKRFRKDKNLQREERKFINVHGQEYFYIARPLALVDSSCLKCHSTPDVAPQQMTRIYGTKNGFGWKLNDINGAQIVYVPTGEIFQRAKQSFLVIMGIVMLTFALAIWVANYWLKKYVVRPIKQVVKVAEAVSTGDMDAEFEKISNDEVGSLVEAFTRMKLSLAMAMKRVEQYRMGNRKSTDT